MASVEDVGVLLTGPNPNLLPETNLFPAQCPETEAASRFLHRDSEAQGKQQRPPDNSGGMNTDIK